VFDLGKCFYILIVAIVAIQTMPRKKCKKEARKGGEVGCRTYTARGCILVPTRIFLSYISIYIPMEMN
jgi:hypothetical protein